MPTCPDCRIEVDESWKFCRYCGHAVASPAPEPEIPVAAQLPADDLMVRLGPGQMRGLLNQTVVVEEGHAALLMLGGRLDQTLSPGKHSIGNILSSRTRDASVILFRTSDIPLDVSVSRLLTSDPLSLSLSCRLVLKIETPIPFLSNLVGGAGSYGTHHLSAALYAPVEEGPGD